MVVAITKLIHTTYATNSDSDSDSDSDSVDDVVPPQTINIAAFVISSYLYLCGRRPGKQQTYTVKNGQFQLMLINNNKNCLFCM